MKNFLLKYHLELYTLITAVMCIYGVLHHAEMSVVRTVVLIMMFVGMFHEWEEKRWPGRFFESVGKVWGWNIENIDMRKPSQWVVYAWMVITIIPFILQSVPGLALAAVYLGIFEAFIHSIGRKLTKSDKKYFPGIVTAWVMAAASVYCLYQLKNGQVCSGADYGIGAVFIIVVFVALQNLVQLSAGHSIRKMMEAMRNR